MKRFLLLGSLVTISFSSLAQERCTIVKDGIFRLGCYLNNVDTKKYPNTEQCLALKVETVQLACFDKENGVFQQPKDSSEAGKCTALSDRTERLNCFDAAYKEPDAYKASTLNVAANPSSKWLIQVRDQGLPKTLPIADPATIGYKHESQRDDVLLKASIIATRIPFSNSGSGWYPFFSLDINQDLSAPKPKRANTKSLGAGVRGTVFDYASTGYAFDSTFKLASKKDSEAHTESVQAIFDNAVVIKRLVIGAPWDPVKTTFQLVPKFGASYEDLREVESTKTPGNFTSAYTGMGLAVWPSFFHRAQINAQAQRFVDTNASTGLAKRYVNFYSFGVDFYLYDPTKDTPFTPIIGLLREIGTNPLNGTISANRTVLALRFKLN